MLAAVRRWGYQYVDPFLPRRGWQFGFIIGTNLREMLGKSFRLLGDFQSTLKFRLIRNWTLREQLKNYAVKPLQGRKWEMGIFYCIEPGDIAVETSGAPI